MKTPTARTISARVIGPSYLLLYMTNRWMLRSIVVTFRLSAQDWRSILLGGILTSVSCACSVCVYVMCSVGAVWFHYADGDVRTGICIEVVDSTACVEEFAASYRVSRCVGIS